MKILFLLRHAKAVTLSSTLEDFDRSLGEEGREQAQRVGEYFKKQNFALDLVVSSTALRARETTEVFLAAAECSAEVRYDQRVYEADWKQLFEMIAAIDKDKSTVLLVGHNPVLEQLVNRLTNRFDPMSTGTLAKIDLKTSEWAKGDELQGQLDWMVRADGLI